MTKKEDLHKGIKSLLKDIEKKSSTEKTDVVKKLSNTITSLSIDRIELNPFQPRNNFNEEELTELAESIKTLGLIQPVTVRSLGGDKYQLISGERRIRACRIAGLKEIPAYIRIADDQSMIEMALVENIQRSDLNSLEIAIAYQRLIDECNLKHEEVADRVGKNRSTVTNYIRLLKLPPAIQNGIKTNLISMGHARALVGVEDPMLQLTLYKDTIDKELSVRTLEGKILDTNKKSAKNTVSEEQSTQNVHVEYVRKKLETFFGSKISISRDNEGKGKLIINFISDDDFNTILEKIGII